MATVFNFLGDAVRLFIETRLIVARRHCVAAMLKLVDDVYSSAFIDILFGFGEIF